MSKLTDILYNDPPDAEGDNAWQKAFEQIPSDGLILEFGVSGGGSITYIANHVTPRKVFGFDWFYGLPEDWTDHVEKAGAFSTNGKVPEVPANVELIVGKVEDTVGPFLQQQNQPIAFINFDLDIYRPTAHCLQAVQDYVKSGTVFRFDEICGAHGKNHEEKAFEEFLARTNFDFELIARQDHDKWIFRLIRA